MYGAVLKTKRIKFYNVALPVSFSLSLLLIGTIFIRYCIAQQHNTHYYTGTTTVHTVVYYIMNVKYAHKLVIIIYDGPPKTYLKTIKYDNR